jgi:predicted DNA binding CopG/RHH family protein
MSTKTSKASSAKIKYTSEPIEAKVIRDFLPRPEELAFREEGVKVTIALSRKSVDFFKSEASKHHTQYQRMIRKLIDTYVDTYAESPTNRSTRSTRKRAAG